MNVRYIRQFFLCLINLVGLNTVAQSISITVPWTTPLQVNEAGSARLISNILNGSYQDGIPFFSFQQEVKSGIYSTTITDLKTESISAEDQIMLNESKHIILDQPEVEIKVVKSKNETFLQLGLFPYVKIQSQLFRIVGFNLNYQLVSKETVSYEKEYVASSVLNSGIWYKVSAPSNGIFKLDKAFFEEMGVDVSSLNPLQVNVYGNAAGRLSENNNGLYFDDLTKNPIFAFGEQDGVFDPTDYFLFYGAGPHRWDFASASGFQRNQNIYSDQAHYFIHIDELDPPARIQNLPNSSFPANQFVETYNHNEIHEIEKYSLTKGGQRWYGELFDGELSQNISFSIPDLVLDSAVKCEYAFATNATTAGNSFQFRYNASVVATQNMSSAGLGDFGRNTGQFFISPTSNSISLNLTFNRVNASVKGYLDFIEIAATKRLNYSNSEFAFRDVSSVDTGAISQFSIAGMSGNNLVWDITNPRSPFGIQGVLTGSDFVFVQATDSLREFIVFRLEDAKKPSFVKQIANQNLHALSQVDYVIVSHPNFIAQANRLEGLHEQSGTSTYVVTTEQIFNEFSSGTPDATAIRRFMKMFYDRANGNAALQPKHLLLFGDGTYDPKSRIGDNNYFVPTYQVLNSENHIASLVTDDYFALLDNNESINGADLMDIGVGRLLISSTDQAIEQVNKIEHYMKNGSQLYIQGDNACCTDATANSTFGDWRLNYSMITDDEEGGYFVNIDAEPAITQVQSDFPEMNYDKIYSDAYIQTSTAGGERYPTVFDAISNRIERGSMVMNYIGHGGEVGAAEERIITIPQIQSWSNINRLPLFVTATCEFTKYDDPSRISAGEWVSLNPTGGAIALMTTTRSVFFGVNSTTIKRFYENVFKRDANNDALTFGEIMRLTKNSSGTSDNRRSFTLIGDPALKIALPKWRIVTDSINHLDPLLSIDTVNALSKMHVVGHVEDYSGALLTNFNGVLSPTIFDKPRVNQTLTNDVNSPLIQFETQKSALYKGKVSVKDGAFSFEFVVPKDIDFNFGKGKISYYANGTSIDADGLDTNFFIGGINPNAAVDNLGPTIKLYMNDTKFVDGSVTSESPLLVIETEDDFGINTVGNGIGHDLVAILDGNTGSPIVLNDFYSGDLDSYQSGKIQYELKGLSTGPHSVEVKIWDVNNNSSTGKLDFVVKAAENIELDHVLNYPNPFTTHTEFYFEHNQSCSSLETQIQIYTVSGRLVKTINQLVATSGFRVEGIAWDGKDDYGDQLAKGVYVYRLSVTLPEGGKAQKIEKLVLLN